MPYKRFNTTEMKKQLLLIALVFSFVATNAQDFKQRTNKGRVYASFGANRTAYDLSTLEMKGSGYDFTLTHYDANDGLELDFSKFNVKLGYFFTEKLSIAIGYDNFNYVTANDKLVKIGGTISDTNGGFEANYNSNEDLIRTTPEFISYGYSKLSYINLNLEIHDDFWVSKKGSIAWSYYFGLGGGVVMTESTVSLFGQDAEVNNNGMSGFGLNTSFGTKFHLGPVFLDFGAKAGYISTKDVAVDSGTGLAKNNFLFASGIASIGFSYQF